ncbi:MAG: N-acetylneuraminate synthase family protein, partial [Pirellulales bacterium]
MSSFFAIADKLIGPGRPCFVVAEVGQAHDGSLGTSHAYIDAAARTGVDAVKFQTHIAAAESTAAEPFRVKFSKQDVTRYDYWKRMEFTPEQWAGLAEHAHERGLIFLSSAFSLEAVELLERIGMPAWKVGSGEIGTTPLLERMAATGKPVLLSNGLADWATLDRAADCVRAVGAPLGVFQCTTAYPCPPERLGLNVLAELAARYACPVGLSDHSGKIFAGLAAATLGANMLEAHIVLSRECFGPDVPASLTTNEFAELVDGIRFIEQALTTKIDKDANAAESANLLKTFGKSVVAAQICRPGRRLFATTWPSKNRAMESPPPIHGADRPHADARHAARYAFLRTRFAPHERRRMTKTNNTHRKVCVVLVDRANYGRLKPVMRALQDHPALELQVVAAGTMVLERFQQPVDVVRADGFPIDGEVYMELEGSKPVTMAKSVGFGIVEFTNEYQRLKPDVVLIIGDRYEVLGAVWIIAFPINLNKTTNQYM